MGSRAPAFQPRDYGALASRSRRPDSTPYQSQTPYAPPPSQQQPYSQQPPPQQPSTTPGYAPSQTAPYQPPQQQPLIQPPPHMNQREARDHLARDGPEAFNALSEDHRDEVDQAFGLFDLDKDKRIDYHELKVAFKALGFDVPKHEILAILQTYGNQANPNAQNEGGRTSYQNSKLLLGMKEFQGLVAQRIHARDPEVEILRAFDLFDEGRKGKISLQDLERVARELGEGLQHEELVAMIEEFDLDGDGCINREEFLGICLG